MEKPKIKIYMGNIKAWTRDMERAGKKRQSVCARRLLAYGVQELFGQALLPEAIKGEEVLAWTDALFSKGPHGKPWLRDFPWIHFSISHSGDYAACAISTTPCGLDIQEIRAYRSRRLLERTMSEAEQQQILFAQNQNLEFCRFWAEKESFLKLTGEGLSRSMKNLPKPAWRETFTPLSGMIGCISADVPCSVQYALI